MAGSDDSDQEAQLAEATAQTESSPVVENVARNAPGDQTTSDNIHSARGNLGVLRYHKNTEVSSHNDETDFLVVLLRNGDYAGEVTFGMGL